MRPFWVLTFIFLLGLCPSSSPAQPSLQARIDAATPGDTIGVDGGAHHGPFVIDKALTLVGTNGAHLQGDNKTHVVTIAAGGVTLQGFRITGSGTQLGQDHAGVMVEGHRATIRNNHLADVLHGIYVKGKNRAVLVENTIEGPPTVTRSVKPDEARRYADCSVPPGGGPCDVPLVSAQRGNGIHLWNALHSKITHNTVYHTRDGMYFSHSDHTYTARNTVRDVRYGLHYMYSDDNVFERNVFYDNASGSALMYSDNITVRSNVFRDNRTQRGYGLLLQTMTDSRFVDNRMTRNGTGVYLENSTRNTFRQNVIAANYRGLRITSSSMENRFSTNVIRGNLHTAAVSGMSATNTWQIDGAGNYWGPRGLLDLDGDDISELPRRTVDVVGGRRDAFPYVGLLAGSPGLALLAEALERVSLPGVPTITDDHPLMRPPDALDDRMTGGVSSAFVLTLLIGAAGAVLLRRVRAHD
ncbi:MAG: NosD protein [Bacteroidetes bacterium]|jgi:nitrous oxidase accessory protein|nr:NosD protein [Bacteroidota bacterium]